jgi:hypothetical protein
MRIGSRLMAWLLATAFAGVAVAAYRTPSRPPLPIEPSAPKGAHFLAFRSLTAQLDNHVLANLLAEVPLRQIDNPLAVVEGEITRCGSKTCTIPLTVRVNGAEGPVVIAFAAANARGELSDVRHAECGTGACSVSLVLERGKNTISVGVLDAIAQTTAYTTLRVDANRVVAKNGKTEWF